MAKAPAAKKKTTKTTTRKTTRRPSAAKKTAGTTRKAAPAKKAPPKKARAARKKAAGPARLPADLKLALTCAQDKQAIDITILDLRNASAFTDFFLICTGANTKQVQAIADGIEKGLKDAGQPPALVEGYNRGEWVLLDYFTFIVHIFLPAQRSFYALEKLWGGAETIEVSSTPA